MTVMVMLSLVALPGRADDLAAHLGDVLQVTRQADGCLGLVETRSSSNAGKMTVFETWRSREDYFAYGRWRRDRGDLMALAQLLDGDASVRVFDVAQTY